MKKTIVIIFAIIVAVIAVWGYLRFVVGGDEDTWLCDNGQWVKHGNPSAARPTSGCGNTNSTNTNTPATNQTSTNEQPAPDPGQFNWSTMDQGPYRDKITYATGTDLLHWTPSGQILAEHASVPGAVVKDSTIYVYFVDVSTDGVKEQLGMVKSTNNGLTWSQPTTLTIVGLGNKATADPAPVLLADGRIRLFYYDINEVRISKSAIGNEPPNKIYSAISSDGVSFVQEDGIRFERQGIFDPDVEKVGDTWYLYGGDIAGNKVIVATSTDGLTFTERGVAYSGGAVPDVWQENDKWYLYTAGINIATSADGLTFASAGIRYEDRDRGNITADPSVIKLSTGSYMMLYKVK